MNQHDLAIRRLKEIGEQQGHVTLEQIMDVLPIDDMTPEEIERVVMQLEEAGVEVVLEEDLLRPRPRLVEDGNVPFDDTPVDTTPIVSHSEGKPIVPPAPLAASPASAAPNAGSPSAGYARGLHRTASLTLVAVLVVIIIGVLLLYALIG